MNKPLPADERKQQILDASEQLFITQGYGATSISQILEKVDIARGTFYYHFQSKMEVKDAIIDQYTDLIRERAIAVANQPELPFQQKVLGVLLAAQQRAGNQTELLDELHRPENEIFHIRSQQRSLDTMVPILTRVVVEAVENGEISAQYPEEAIEMMLLYANSAFDDMAENEPEKQLRKVQGFIHHTELLLGAEPGSFAFLLEMMGGAQNEDDSQ